MTSILIGMLLIFSGAAHAAQKASGPTLPVPPSYGNFKTSVAVLPLDHSTIKGLLPNGLTISNDHSHTVYFLNGQNSDIKVKDPDSEKNLAYLASYREAILIIPNVALESHPESQFTLMAKLFLDRQIPVDVGVNFYGFNKQLAYFQKKPNLQAIHVSLPGPIEGTFFDHLAVEVTAKETLSPTPAQVIEDFVAAVRAPLIAKTLNPDLQPVMGQFTCSEFKSTVNPEHKSQLVHMKLQFSPGFGIDALAAKEKLSAKEAFTLEYDWVLGSPTHCSNLM